MPNVMVVTENGKLKTFLLELLGLTPYDPLEAPPHSSLSHLKQMMPPPDAIIMADSFHSDTEFFARISQFRQAFPLLTILAVADTRDVDFIVQVMQAGADTYLMQSGLSPESLRKRLDETSRIVPARHSRAMPPGISLADHTLEMRHQAARPETLGSMIVRIDDLIINNQKLSASFRETLLDLSPTEFEILSCLAYSAGQVVTFEELVYQVYGLQTNRDQARRTLAAHMSNLRGKLRDVGADDYLTNRRGRGYLIERKSTTVPLTEYQQIEHYQQVLETLVSQVPNVALCLYDPDRNILVSKGQILAQRPNLYGSQDSPIFDFAEKHANFDNQIDAVFDNKAFHQEHEDGGQHYTIDLLPVTDSYGQVPMGMILVQDISTLKQLDSLVDGEIETLTSKIMTQVTSEIRTILTTLQTSTEMLVRYRDRIPENEQVSRLNQIHADIDHLVEYFEAISSLSQTISTRQR